MRARARSSCWPSRSSSVCPFAHVGEELPEGRAYRAYFTADFVWEVAVVAELAKATCRRGIRIT